MKIVNRKQFLELPSGTVYSHYIPQISEGLMIKGDTWANDWLYQDLLFNVEGETSDEASSKLIDAEENGTSFKLDLNCGSRDGMFEENQLFMVYENSDIERLIGALKKCL